jgi:8-oxo-dGTP pyrophosphatase MutT (NUDIX family)
MSIIDRPLRAVLKSLHWILKLKWFLRRPRTFGAHAVALTPAGKIVLVKLRYADGWRVPGGGRKRDEKPEQAVLRELREEIGMTSHGAVDAALELEESTDFKRDLASLLVVRDVEYRRPRWSWEVEDLLEADLDQLPRDLSPRSAKWIATVLAQREQKKRPH